ncbi:DUF1269 domain-containing protein [Pseudoduganella buxea]|uniref:DUF1269 domain-containing protein n=1 Tax=Pseudoduganella buxea TaxID=1949069 RepID=A0A6I3STA5_9BURK|nr:DUF1269 domain-containing protein [Pseudoduganella buxea]MTV51157.1 DUF1269 domain-containing protein [Pseudoduganella buxea]GGB96139.1 hypothetical protein GCM10011572_17650 [Pseudoduganella buxea]
MRRRLYYLLPDIPSARTMLDELLLARIEERHIHFMAREGSLPDDMPGCSFAMKTDLVHGAQVGIVMGATIGFLVGFVLALSQPYGLDVPTGMILLMALGGALFGAWASGMNGCAIPNKKLEQYTDRIEQGQVLMMVDVPVRRIVEIEDMIARRHPNFNFAGVEPPMLAFP